ncbi:MAG TPA: MFS transporter [Rhizomicrobium sp.]|nr:MFS transporter [Rhizomicrobium sp.]
MQPRLSRSQLAAVVAGNALEFYDFLIYGFFAVQIGQTFFPAQNSTTSLLLALMTFAAGFLTRPLGGFVIGPLGDRIGRKPAMMLSFGLMGFSIVGLALTPSYASIGLAAPLLAVIFRLLQGFALGGEVGPTTTLLLEAAPAQKRGLYASLQFATQWAASLCYGIVGAVLAKLMTPADLTQWGWRIAMLLGSSVVPLALAIRRSLPETLAPQQARQKWQRPSTAQIGLVLRTLLMIASATIATYALLGINLFATHTLGLSPAQASGGVIIGGVVGVIFNPIGGWLSDRLGRKPLMIGAHGLLCLVGLPCFMAIAQLRTPGVLYAAVALMSALLALGLPSILTQVAEGLPAEMRSGAIGIIYAVAVSLFGGTASLIVTWLTSVTGSPLAPAWYMCGALALGVLSMLTLRETAPVKTGG